MDISNSELQRCWDVSFNKSLSILKNRDDAEDIAQMAIMKLITTGNIEKPEQWIKTVAKNMAIETIRFNKKTVNIIKEIPVSTEINSLKIPVNMSDVLIKFSESGSKLRFFAKNNNLSYNQARSMIYSAVKNLKAEI